MEMEQDQSPIFYNLIDEDGKEMEFELLDTLQEENQTYYAMIPHFENSDESLEYDGDVIILKCVEVDGEEMLASIDNDEEYNRIGNIMLERINEMFSFEDEEEDDEIATYS